MARIQRGTSAAVREFRRRWKVLTDPRYKTFRGAHVTSFTRSPILNASVGGRATSQHTTGTAADISYRPLPTRQWPVAKVRRAARRAGLILIDERVRTQGTGPHFHFQLFKANQTVIET